MSQNSFKAWEQKDGGRPEKAESREGNKIAQRQWSKVMNTYWEGVKQKTLHPYYKDAIVAGREDRQTSKIKVGRRTLKWSWMSEKEMLSSV